MSQAKRSSRLAQYEQIVALRKQGFSQTAIAEQVGIGHATVSRWLTHDMFPEQQPCQRKSRLDATSPFSASAGKQAAIIPCSFLFPFEWI